MKKRTILIISLLIFSTLIFSMCTPPLSLSDLNIESMVIYLDEVDQDGNTVPGGNDVSVIKPGQRYRLLVQVYTVEGQTNPDPENVDYTDLIVNPANDSFTYHPPEGNVTRAYVTATSNNFTFIDGSTYEIFVEVAYNSFEGHTQQWDIDWSNDTLDFSGNTATTSGETGFPGNDGADSADSHGEPGENGQPGGDGNNGENGDDVSFEMAYYDISDVDINGIDPNETRMIILRNLDTNDLTLFKKNIDLKIVTSGGDGSNGGNGGLGGDGGDYTGDPAEGWKGGNGGNGGNGGQGGDGGNVSIDYVNGTDIANLLSSMNDPTLRAGGQGGLYGNGGNGGQGGDPDGLDGQDGQNGQDGSDGTGGSWQSNGIVDTNNIFNNISDSNFDKSKLTGELN